MRKMVGLMVVIMVLAFSVNASAAYLYCDWINEGTTRRLSENRTF